MFKELKKIVHDNSFKITILDNKININNYEEILIFEDDEVLVKIDTRLIKIKGSEFIINRLENNELFIIGKIKNIEFR